MSIYVKQSFGVQELSDGGQWEYNEAKLYTDDISAGTIEIFVNKVSKLIMLNGWFQPSNILYTGTLMIATELPKIPTSMRFTAMPYSGISNSISLVYDSKSMLFTDSNFSQKIMKEKYFIHTVMGVYIPA